MPAEEFMSTEPDPAAPVGTDDGPDDSPDATGAALDPEVVEPEGGDEAGPEAAEYSIDALAAHTGLPSRTIRFYQSKGALQKPEIRGRKAVYTDAHVERLELIGQLQDRGLRIRAIRDLVERIDKGELVLSEWLGLQDTLVAPWGSEGARLLTEAELVRLTGPLPAGKLAELVRLGLVERKAGKLLVHHPQRLQVLMQLEEKGVSVAVGAAALERSRKHVGRLARDLAGVFEDHAGEGFGGGDASGLSEAIEAWRSQGPGLVAGVFAEEMRQVLLELVASGKGSKLRG